MASILADRKMPNTGGWQTRHDSAFWNPNDAEAPIKLMLQGWEKYAQNHKMRYDDLIANDHFLGPVWQGIGEEIRSLLNGETGRFDCGTLDGFILNTMSENGVDTSSL